MTCEEFKALRAKAIRSSTSAERMAAHRHVENCPKCRRDVLDSIRKKAARDNLTLDQLLEMIRVGQETLARDSLDPENRNDDAPPPTKPRF